MLASRRFSGSPTDTLGIGYEHSSNTVNAGSWGRGWALQLLFRTVGGRSGKDWEPIQYAPDAPDRRKIMVVLEAVKK